MASGAWHSGRAACCDMRAIESSMRSSWLARSGAKITSAYRGVQELTARERRHLLSEILQVRGLMPLLMKQRNKGRWSPEDRAQLRIHLRRLSDLSPYLVVLALPGSFLLLPMLAWWLDRRRMRNRRAQGAQPGV
jgi:hypothetical protein